MPKTWRRSASGSTSYPNLYVEIASRIAELGRQPFTARRFFLKYQDRILFGTDGPWPEERVRLYWRFLETDDEYFPYSETAVSAAGLLEHLRRRPARRRAAQGLSRERRADHSGRAGAVGAF